MRVVVLGVLGASRCPSRSVALPLPCGFFEPKNGSCCGSFCHAGWSGVATASRVRVRVRVRVRFRVRVARFTWTCGRRRRPNPNLTLTLTLTQTLELQKALLWGICQQTIVTSDFGRPALCRAALHSMQHSHQPFESCPVLNPSRGWGCRWTRRGRGGRRRAAGMYVLYCIMRKIVSTLPSLG